MTFIGIGTGDLEDAGDRPRGGPGVGHSFAFGLERDEQGDIHEESYRALQLMTGFFRRWVKSPAP